MLLSFYLSYCLKTNRMYSIVIPAHNEEADIFNILNDLFLQNFDKSNYEVIVVDNASTDQTLLQVWNFLKNHSRMRLRVVHENRLGVSMARNAGALNSKFENLIFLDSDNRVAPDFLSLLNHYSSNNEIAVATMRTLPDVFKLKEHCFFLLLELIKLAGLRPFGKIFVKRAIFYEINGFDTNITLGENVDFLVRAKEYAKSENLNFAHFTKSTIKCSLRRFKKKNFFLIVIPWFIAYIGLKNLSYETMHNINRS